MTHATGGIIGGFDCHKDAHVGAVVDRLGHLMGTASFPTDAAGYRQALAWLRSFGAIDAIGIESTGSYGAALARCCSEVGERVVGTNPKTLHVTIRTR